MIHMRDYNAFEARNVKFLVNKQISYATIQITQTGINKSTLDATAPVRAFFVEKNIHDFDVVIIDEVSKATPPELLLPLMKAKKVVL